MLNKAENASTTVKWTMVGVMNIFKPFGLTRPACADKVMTMNVNPVSAAADEPAMTKKLSQPARSEGSIIGIIECSRSHPDCKCGPLMPDVGEARKAAGRGGQPDYHRSSGIFRRGFP